ncbi:hypothetical protein Ciccas_006900 [Cichlidogyrus casuarinus]|uniref:Queuosine 5'-phosphate N-glycosylase/hydrolase n=1 Tax=Cichlidogyrus casuarinus TaxID=1844966 RepID=A0ABD2Q5Q7_9PLAT
MLPRESAEYIVGLAKHVKYDDEKTEELSQMLFDAIVSKQFGKHSYSSHPMHPKDKTEAQVNWIFFIDLLNFSFWTEEPKYCVNFKNENYTGYFALCAALNRAINEGYQLDEPRIFSEISQEKLAHVLRSNSETEIPLLKERLDCLHQAGHTLLNNFDGSFVNCVKKSDKSAQKLLELILENFPCFRDSCTYENKTVTFYKRAQILIADLWLCFDGESYGEFHDIDTLTAFADYRVPQVLAYFGSISYDSHLMEKLSTGQLLLNGSEEEAEIRGITIFACEKLKEKTAKKLAENGSMEVVNSILVDNFLWDFRRDHVQLIETSIPMHKTRCIFY